MVSIGISTTELNRADALIGTGAEVIVIDVANGAQQGMVDQVKALRTKFGMNIMIVAGNVATSQSISELAWRSGASAIDMYKVGIGPGSACTTRTKTGVGVPQLSAIIDCVASSYPVIADGGMKKAGDVAKALGAGAKMVMLGGMLAGTDETPGESDNGYKKYRGSASSESYEAQGKVGKHRTSEGESFMVKCKGPVEDILQDINGGVRSTCTYVNARDLRELHRNSVFQRISANTVTENGAHGKS
jgi:IMP dehydrogenase/GMP reductase